MAQIKILVVDDEEEICRLTCRFLAREGYNVFSAVNGESAINLIKKEHPEITLLDIRLSNESGLEVLKKIKEIDKDIKVIMVTALNDEENIKEARSLGASDYIAKPFTREYLTNLILEKIAHLKSQEQMQRAQADEK